MKSADKKASDVKERLKSSFGEDRAPSPIPPSPPSSPQTRRQESNRLGSEVSLISDPASSSKAKSKVSEKDALPAPSSPINIPVSKAKKQITPGLEAVSLNSLTHVPASSFLVGRSHYSSQPITIEYYITERTVEDASGQTVKKQATTIRSIGDYQVIRTIGSGSTGKVKLAVNLNNGLKVAVKIISRKYIQEPGKNSKETPASRRRRILREAAILNLASHPNIVRLHDLYVTDEYYCMVFEYVDGGQMLDYIISRGKLAEPAARRFFSQLISAVAYCHANGIVHRDLKIENVLIDARGDVKLVDFGLSNFYDPDAKLKTFCGSLYFAAPELLKGITYTGPEVDVWSLGIILYVLVAGKVPFDDKSLSALHEKIKSGRFTVPLHLSPECQNLVKVMIEVDPEKRATLGEIMTHPWMQSEREFLPLPLAEPEPLVGVLNRDIEAFLIREFPYQFEEDEIRRVLQASQLDPKAFARHPIIALYRLAQGKQERLKFALNGFDSPALPVRREEPVAVNEAAAVAPEPVVGSLPVNLPQGRKRADSLPVKPVAALGVGKSKRSASLQTDEKANLPQVLEEGDLSGTSSSDEAMKIRTVYLKGIFSVNTTSTKRPSVIRKLVIDCLTNLHAHEIIFLDRESYFICEFQAQTRAIVDDDSAKADASNDIDISRLNLNDAAALEEANPKLTFGAAPARSIRFEIHIVRVALLGLNGVQFKRISGDFSAYKTLCTKLIEEFKL